MTPNLTQRKRTSLGMSILNMKDINLKIKGCISKMLKFIFYTNDLDPNDPLFHKKKLNI
jgi:hypothetical protein